MHTPNEVLKGIKLPSEKGIVTGRIYNWLRDLNEKIKPASCTVKKIHHTNFGDFFIDIATKLVQSAGVNIVVDDVPQLITAVKTYPRNGRVVVYDSSDVDIENYEYINIGKYSVADSLMLVSEKSKKKYNNHISIFESWKIAYEAVVFGQDVYLDFADVRLPDELSSGHKSFMDVCRQIAKFAEFPTLTGFLKCLSDICSTIKRGGFRRHGAMTASLESTSPAINEYLDIPFGYLTHLKKGVLIRQESVYDLDLIERLIEKQNAGELFFEKFLGYSEGINKDVHEELRTNVCLPADTLVITKQGNKFIGEIVGKEVEIFDGEVWTTAVFEVTSPASEVFKVELADGRVIKATEEHEFILSNGKRKPLKELQIGEVLKEVYLQDYGIRSADTCKPAIVLKKYSHSFEAVYCCYVETTNAFLLSNNILIGNCRGLGLIPDDQCLVSPVNLGMCRTYENIIEGFKEMAQFLVDVHNKQIQDGHDIKDKQIAVGICGLANCLRNLNVSYHDFIECLYLYNTFNNFYCPEKVKSRSLKDSLAYKLVEAIATGIQEAAEIGRKNGMRATLAIEPNESCARRYKDYQGYDVCPNIDPPDVVSGVGIERRHSDTGVFDSNGNHIYPEFNYGKDIFPAQQLSEKEHFMLWNEMMKIFDRTGQGHSGSYEQWHPLTLVSFFEWWDSNLKFIYYNRSVGTKHLVKAQVIPGRDRLKNKQTCTLDMREAGCETCD